MPDAMTITQGGATPFAQAPTDPLPSQQVYRALQSQRQVLGDQLGTAQRMRDRLVGQLSDGRQTGAARASLEKRIANIDEQISSLDKQIAQSDQAVAQAAAVPGATIRPPELPRNRTPDLIGGLGALFIICAILPISIASARRMWRKAARAEVTLPPEVAQRMESLERGVEAIALEVERIGEGQRFVTQALAERGEIRALGQGAAEPLPVRQRERLEERR